MYPTLRKKTTSNNEHFDDDNIKYNFHIRSFKTPNSKGGFLQQHYITNTIVTPDIYIDFIQDVRLSNVNDDIYIYLNSEGGMVDTGIQIINAINESRAPVFTVLDGKASSIAANIFLAGDSQIVYNHGSVMIHNFSAGVQGKGHELLQTVTGFQQYITKLMHDYYIPFLTEEEFDRVIDGKDFWFTADEVRERLDVINELRTRDMLAEAKQQCLDEISSINQQIEEIDKELNA